MSVSKCVDEHRPNISMKRDHGRMFTARLREIQVELYTHRGYWGEILCSHNEGIIHRLRRGINSPTKPASKSVPAVQIDMY